MFEVKLLYSTEQSATTFEFLEYIFDNNLFSPIVFKVVFLKVWKLASSIKWLRKFGNWLMGLLRPLKMGKSWYYLYH